MARATLPTQMRAQTLNAFNEPYTFATVPLPEISSEHQMLVKIEATGYCPTDAVLASGRRVKGPSKFPHIGGHEFAGTIVALAESPSAAAQQYRVGSRVGVPPYGFGACGTCFECANPADSEPGYSFYCPTTGDHGLTKDGGFAEYVVVDARQVVPLADSLAAVDAAPLMCAGVTIFNAIKKCKLSAGQRLGIIGCGGGLGHLGLQFADAMGLRVTGVDAADAPLRLAESLKTKAHIVDARTVSPEEVVEQIGKEDSKAEVDKADRGLDAVIILASSQDSFDYGVKLLRKHALCLVLAIPKDGFRVSTLDLVYRDIKVQGSLLGDHAVLRETVDFAAKHNVRPVKKTFPLERLNDLLDEYHRGFGGKLILDMSLSQSTWNSALSGTVGFK